MFDTQKRKADRMSAYANRYLDTRVYNMVLGGCVLYGLVINLILTLTMHDAVATINPTVLLIGYFASAIAGCFISAKSDNPFISFIGYNMICVPIGLVLSVSIGEYAIGTILLAIGLTAAVTFIITLASIMFPELFSGLGKALFVTLVAVIVVELVSLMLGLPTGWIDIVCVVLFSLYIGYDYYIAQRYPKTLDNAVDSSIDIYLDIINLFLSILDILSDDD